MKKYILLICVFWTMHSVTAIAKIDPNAPKQERLDKELFNAVLANSISEDIERLLKNRADLNVQKIDFGNSTLEDIERLLQDGANPNVQHTGWTPLMLICSQRKTSLRAVEALLEAGANPNIKNKRGETALMLASENSTNIAGSEIIKIVKALLKAGADANAAEETDESAPLMHACWNTNLKISPDIVRELLNAGANPRTEKLQRTALTIACNRKNPSSEIVKELLARNVDVNHVQQSTRSRPLIDVFYSPEGSVVCNSKGLVVYSPESIQEIKIIVSALLSKGADPNVQNNGGQVPLLGACKKFALENTSDQNEAAMQIVKELILKGAHPNVWSYDLTFSKNEPAIKCTPLALLCYRCAPIKIIQELLRQKLQIQGDGNLNISVADNFSDIESVLTMTIDEINHLSQKYKDEDESRKMRNKFLNAHNELFNAQNRAALLVVAEALSKNEISSDHLKDLESIKSPVMQFSLKLREYIKTGGSIDDAICTQVVSKEPGLISDPSVAITNFFELFKKYQKIESIKKFFQCVPGM